MVTSSKSRPSATVLVVLNLIPLFGVMHFEWSLFAVIFMYWMENVVIGILNIARMGRATGQIPRGTNMKMNGKPFTAVMKIPLILFFIMHYGIFTTVHGIFVFALFGPVDVGVHVLLVGVFSLSVSHMISYFTNFIGNEEYKRVSAPALFFHPYKRIVVLHLVLIFGGMVVQFFGAPVLALTLLIALKIMIDLGMHMWEHGKLQGTTIKGV